MILKFLLELWKVSDAKAPGKPETNTISSWSNDMEGHAKQCVERYCEPAQKKLNSYTKVATPCFDDHQFKEEEMGSVGELSKVCSQIVLTCLYLARICRPNILCSVNKLARGRVHRGGHPLWRRVFTGAGLAAPGRRSLAHGYGDCRWCHDEAH